MTTAYAPAPEQAAADASALPLDEIRTLVDERGRYEGWLEALDARRAVTPAHVLERVRQDYAGRLDRVAQRLATHVGPLRAHEAALAQQHHAVEQRLGEERDGLAEIELRTLVGEFAADEGEQRRAVAQHGIAALERELGGASAGLAEVRALVVRVTPVQAPGTAEVATPVRAPAPTAEPVAAPAPEVPTAGMRDAYENAPSFDHGAVDAARVALGDSDRSLTPAFTDAIRGGGTAGAYGLSGARPQAAEPSAAGQEKTLRCQDCGALNFPTEWYCEKCGGELAAL